jgi:hypothetical protein
MVVVTKQVIVVAKLVQVGDYDTMVVKVVVVAVVMMDKAVKLAPKVGIMPAHVGTLQKVAALMEVIFASVILLMVVVKLVAMLESALTSQERSSSMLLSKNLSQTRRSRQLQSRSSRLLNLLVVSVSLPILRRHE